MSVQPDEVPQPDDEGRGQDEEWSAETFQDDSFQAEAQEADAQQPDPAQDDEPRP